MSGPKRPQPARVATVPTFLRAAAATFLLALGACSNSGDGRDPTREGSAGSSAATTSRASAGTQPVAAPLAIEHDFGILVHGEAKSHEIELPLDLLRGADGEGTDYVPLRVHLECSCGRANLILRKPDGSERYPDGTGYARNLPTAGERAYLQIEIDSRRKEAVDLKKTASRGYVLLQPVDDPDGTGRKRWPFVVRFGIDAPVVLQPFASLEFGRVPVCRDGERITTLRGDDKHGNARFVQATSTDEDLHVTLEQTEEHTVLRARVRPGRLGHHRAAVAVATDIDGPDGNAYTIALEARWKVVPAIEALPMAKLSFTTRLQQAQTPDASNRQFVIVEDHDHRRPPEFEVREIHDRDGNDAAKHFACEFESVAGNERQQRLKVRYIGGLDGTFRGRIVLAKPGDADFRNAENELPIDLVVLPSRKP